MQPVVFFLHVAKTGGTTLNTVLARGVRRPRRQSIDSFLERGRSYRAMPPERRDSFDLVHGHFYFGLHRATRRPVVMLSMLRDPVERVISHYYGNPSRRPDHYMHAAALRFPLGEYLVRAKEMHAEGALEVDNFMVRLFAGEESLAVPFGAVGGALFEQARRHLREMHVVGVFERFEESVLLLRRVLGWSRLRCLYTRRNVGIRPRLVELDVATRRALDDCTGWDRELYAEAQRLFERQRAAAGAALGVELGRFRRELAVFESLSRLRGNVIERFTGRAAG